MQGSKPPSSCCTATPETFWTGTHSNGSPLWPQSWHHNLTHRIIEFSPRRSKSMGTPVLPLSCPMHSHSLSFPFPVLELPFSEWVSSKDDISSQKLFHTASCEVLGESDWAWAIVKSTLVLYVAVKTWIKLHPVENLFCRILFSFLFRSQN